MTGAIGTHLTTSGHHYGPDTPIVLLGQKWVPRDVRCVASARRFVRDIALDWDAADGVSDHAELLASEVVTNALTYGAQERASGTVRVTVGRDGALMTVDVYDFRIAVPQIRAAGAMDTSGRGLAIVGMLAHAWGWNRHRDGKSVWFQLLAWPRR